jgi:hypothetical protein
MYRRPVRRHMCESALMSRGPNVQQTGVPYAAGIMS